MVPALRRSEKISHDEPFSTVFRHRNANLHKFLGFGISVFRPGSAYLAKYYPNNHRIGN